MAFLLTITTQPAAGLTEGQQAVFPGEPPRELLRRHRQGLTVETITEAQAGVYRHLLTLEPVELPKKKRTKTPKD